MWKTGICELMHRLHTAALLLHFTAALFLAMNEPLFSLHHHLSSKCVPEESLKKKTFGGAKRSSNTSRL